MADLAASAEFSVLRCLLGRQARKVCVENVLLNARDALDPGDILLLTFSGHGCREPDRFPFDERDRFDETWCLADEPLFDDALHQHWGKFEPGVRILVISDSCHSESIWKRAKRVLRKIKLKNITEPHGPSDVGGRCDPSAGITAPWLPLRESKENIPPSVLLLAACKEDEFAREQADNGLFTEELLRLWDAGRYPGRSYAEFIGALSSNVNKRNREQTPSWRCDGAPNPAFLAQRPFTI